MKSFEEKKWPNDELLAIVDGNNMIMRAYFAMQSKGLTTSEGVSTGALFGSILTHINIVRTISPTKMIWFFDARGGSDARKEIYPEYKSQRPGNHDIGRQFTAFEHFLSVMDVRYFSEKGIEADDLIASAVDDWSSDIPKVIISGDRDFHQLVSKNPKVSVYNPGKGDKALSGVYSYKNVSRKYHMPPESLVDAWSICGDKSDNIQGVKGIGFKTARRLLERNNWDLADAIKYEPRLNGWKERIEINKRLIDLRSGIVDVNLQVHLDECHLRKAGYDSESLQRFLSKWEMFSLHSKERAIGIYN